MFGLGMGEVLIIGMVAFLFIGPKKLPELGKGIGEAIKNFKNETKIN